MPATSKAIRRATAIAEHHPEELYGRNKSLLNMSKGELHKFASTPEKGLPEKSSKTSLRSIYKRGKARKSA